MALILTIELDNGLIVEDAYHRIGHFSGEDAAMIRIDSYVSQEAYASAKTPLLQRLHTFPHDITDSAPNIKKQGYQYLKTLLEYENAEDVLEGQIPA